MIDWGLSEFYLPEKEYHTRVSSRPYKGPELLIGYRNYDFSMDIWSVGCMFAAFIFRKDYFFLGKDNQDQLVEIVNFLGTKGFNKYINRLNIVLEPHLHHLFKRKNQKSFENLIDKNNRHLTTKEALDLL